MKRKQATSLMVHMMTRSSTLFVHLQQCPFPSELKSLSAFSTDKAAQRGGLKNLKEVWLHLTRKAENLHCHLPRY